MLADNAIIYDIIPRNWLVRSNNYASYLGIYHSVFILFTVLNLYFLNKVLPIKIRAIGDKYREYLSNHLIWLFTLLLLLSLDLFLGSISQNIIIKKAVDNVVLISFTMFILKLSMQNKYKLPIILLLGLIWSLVILSQFQLGRLSGKKCLALA